MQPLIEPLHWLTTLSLIIPLVTFTHAQTWGTRIFTVTNSSYKCGRGLRWDLSYLMWNLCHYLSTQVLGVTAMSFNMAQSCGVKHWPLRISYISNANYDHYNDNDKVGVSMTEREKGCDKIFLFHTKWTPYDPIRCNSLHTRRCHLSMYIISLYLQ